MFRFIFVQVVIFHFRVFFLQYMIHLFLDAVQGLSSSLVLRTAIPGQNKGPAQARSCLWQ